MKNDDYDDSFTLVTRKLRSLSSKSSPEELQEAHERLPCQPADSSLPKETIVKQVVRARKDLQDSKFLSSALKGVEKTVNEIGHTQVHHILCYGLGHFSSCVTARYQLAFLLCLRDRFNSSVQIYDPIFTEKEQQVLPETFSFELITHNEEGKRVIDPNSCTLVFAPHCPKQLTNNFLWANWSPDLKNCVYLGNSFLKIIFNPACLIETAQYILKISPFTTELALANTFRFKDIFNDLAYHTFNTSQISPELWSYKEDTSPDYPADDTGIIITCEDVSQFANFAPSTSGDSEGQQ